MEEGFTPPSHPPPLLTNGQILSFAAQGHMNFPLPSQLQQSYKKVFETANQFFAQANETKSKLYPNPEGRPEVGYTNNVGEKQYLTLRCRTHPDMDLEKHVRDAWHDTGMLLLRVLVDLAYAMGLADPDQVWDPVLDGCLTLPGSEEESTTTIFRVFEYEPLSGVAESHVDIGLLTLCVCQGDGLQVQHLTNEGPVWKDVEGPTLLAASALQSLTGMKVRAGRHRVVANPKGRSSIIFALRPSLRHEIDLRVYGGGISTSPKEFWGKHTSARYNINASANERERQKDAILKRKEKTMKYAEGTLEKVVG
ncbi:hypothetical protein NA57DRAFT_79477 [Rhizodiscina lignyota]|uniref:Uncharacterized protein n=1 Tax=Rhizodiscina lignyota TaxID=1504668 RepID=A0A9P4IAB5_9PEZI|nr:hypothetical protein NA57DRAFT_79477 [Rhizodiscina lignyota]